MMDDIIRRQDAIDAVEFGITYAKVLNKETGEVVELFKKSNEELQKAVDRIEALPSAQPNLQPTCNNLATDTISRQVAIDDMCKHFNYDVHDNLVYWNREHVLRVLKDLPSVQSVRVWRPVKEYPKHHNDVIVRGIETIGNVVVHKVMQWDVDTWRPTDYAPSVIWKEWSEI